MVVISIASRPELLPCITTVGRRLCRKQLILDTALGNSRGQRFYFRQGLLSRALHFGQALPEE
ncbi:hypothetical protein [Variovorax sp. WS11]|uniref:hypothetical protein n=1 Tax=Variovorax sp. WS11 TaxID=1105204 RepID=UPI0026B2E007|nr:hypothetical protein [Variovorax sp. WS11]